MADQNAVNIAIAEETTFGVLASVTGTDYKYLRFTSEGFRFAGNTVASAEIDATRQPQGQVRVSVNSEGSLNTELSLRTPSDTPTLNGYDSLIEGIAMSDWQDVVDVTATSQDIELTSTTPTTFDCNGSVTPGAFTNVTTGQWIKLSGYATNGTVYGFVTTWTDSDQISCSGCTSTGAGVQTESAASDISISGSYIRLGTTKKSYTVQKYFTDLDTVEYALGTGMRVGSMDFGVSSEAILTAAFTFLGKLMATSTNNAISASPGSVVAKWATTKLNATSHVPLRFEGAFDNSGVRSSTVLNAPRMTNLSFTLNNGLSTQPEIGDGLAGPGDITIGNPTVEGALEIYMENGEIIRKAEAEVASKLAWLIDDTNNDVQWMISFPNILYRPGVNADAASNEAPLIASFQWDATPDTVNGVSFQIDRFGPGA
jgi:hypothetical protein